MEEHLYSKDGYSISCFIHIYTYIHFHMYRIEPFRAVECLFSFFGVISASAGATGVKFSIQQLFYCLTTPPPRMLTDWLFWKSPAPERLTLGWVGEATGG